MRRNGDGSARQRTAAHGTERIIAGLACMAIIGGAEKTARTTKSSTTVTIHPRRYAGTLNVQDDYGDKTAGDASRSKAERKWWGADANEQRNLMMTSVEKSLTKMLNNGGPEQKQGEEPGDVVSPDDEEDKEQRKEEDEEVFLLNKE